MYVVTTYPDHAVYEQAFGQGVGLWPVPVVVYTNSPPTFPVRHRPLSCIEGYNEFMATPIFPPNKPNGFLWDVQRFAHKAFVIIDNLFQYEPFFWLDADVETHHKIPVEFLEELIDGVPFCYLGRSSYTETGFLGFNPRHPDFDKFARRFRSCYRDNKIFTLPAWTDCHAFDFAREGIEGRDLSPGGKGFDHVWETSVLQDYMTHHKGPKRKEIAYG